MIILYYSGKPNQKYRGAVTNANYAPLNDFLRCYDEDVDGLLDLRVDGQPVFLRWKQEEKLAEAPKQVWINMMPVEGRFPEKKDESMIKILHTRSDINRVYTGFPSKTTYHVESGVGTIRAYFQDVQFLLMLKSEERPIFSLTPFEEESEIKFQPSQSLADDVDFLEKDSPVKKKIEVTVSAAISLPELVEKAKNGEEEEKSEGKEDGLEVECFDFTALHRVGRARSDAIIEAGMCTLDDILKCTTLELAAAIGVTKQTAEVILASAVNLKSND